MEVASGLDCAGRAITSRCAVAARIGDMIVRHAPRKRSDVGLQAAIRYCIRHTCRRPGRRQRTAQIQKVNRRVFTIVLEITGRIPITSY